MLLVFFTAAAAAAADYQLPLAFERNDGQTDAAVQYLARGAGYNVFLTGSETVLVLDKQVVRMKLHGASATPAVTALEPLQSRSNYLVGNDPKAWQRDVPHYGKVRYDDVYPGIDALFYGNDRRLEFDFVVAPGADPRAIAMTFDGVESLRIGANGDLVLKAGDRELRQLAPVVYQETSNGRREIAARYVLRGRNRAAFRIAKYDVTKPLVIDPILMYGTLHGGNYYDWSHSIAVDGSGYAYITGQAGSYDFPKTGRIGPPEELGYSDAFVAKFDPVGRLVYSTILGSTGPDTGYGIAVNATGHAYVTGEFSSNGAPITAGAYATAPWGADAYVFKLNPQGNGIVYGARVGGRYDDRAYGIALDANDNAIVTGVANGSLDFPTVNAAQPVYGGGYTDGFVFKLNASGSALVFSTYLGGGTVVQNNNRRIDEAKAIAVDAAGNAYVTGFTDADDFPTTPGALTTWGSADPFVVKYSPSGAIVYSARFGSDSGGDYGWSIAVDAAGSAYVTGSTNYEYPTTPGAFQTSGTFDAFVTKLNVDGSAFVYSTYLGGVALEGSGSDNGEERGYGIAVNAKGEAFVTGFTRSRNFPLATPMDNSLDLNNSRTDAFVTKFNAAGSGLIYSTYLGANSEDIGRAIALDKRGNAYVTGSTSSTLFPTTVGAAQRTNGSDDGNGNAHDDAFVVKLADKVLRPAPVDFSGDGTSDMVWKHKDGELAVWQLAGKQLTGSTTMPMLDPDWEIAGYGDFSGDGKADIVLRHTVMGDVGLWEMDGPNVTNGATLLQVTDLSWQILAVTDLNGDGQSEILWRHGASGNIVAWEVRDHKLIRGWVLANVSDPNMQLIATGDFDGNGDTELLWRNASTAAIAMWDLTGASLTSIGTVATATDPNRRVEATGDFNGDGMIDVLWRSSTTGTVSMWIMRGAFVAQDAVVRAIADFNWQVETAGDYDGNGRAEIVWRYKPNGSVALWEMAGPTLMGGTTIGTRDTTWTIQPR